MATTDPSGPEDRISRAGQETQVEPSPWQAPGVGPYVVSPPQQEDGARAQLSAPTTYRAGGNGSAMSAWPSRPADRGGDRYGDSSSGQWRPPQPAGVDRLAVWAVICANFGFLILPIFAAVALGSAALVRIARTDATGRALAILAFVLSAFWLLITPIAYVLITRDDASVAIESTVPTSETPTTTESASSPEPTSHPPATPTPSGSTDPGQVHTIPALKLEVGDCLPAPPAGGPASTFEIIDCSQPHFAEVYLRVKLPEGEFPGSQEFEELGDATCTEAFTEFVGMDYKYSSLEFFYYGPNANTWDADGDNELMCLIHEADHDRVTGTLQGANR